MKYSLVNKTTEVSKLCFGCEALGGTDWGKVNLKDIELAIELALDSGVNFFDTADVYGLGLSEERLSSILGERRHNLLIATKGGVSWTKDVGSNRAKIKMDSSPRYLRDAVENSLRRLQLDQLPIYYLHWPDPEVDIRLSFECLNELQEEGKIDLLGCSNYSAEQISQAAKVSNVSLVQLPLNIISGPLTSDIVNVCNKNEIQVVAYNVLASGLLTGKYDKSSRFSENDRRSKMSLFQGDELTEALIKVDKAKAEAHKAGLSVAQYAINWAVKQKHVASVITGVKNIEQIKKNVEGIF